MFFVYIDTNNIAVLCKLCLVCSILFVIKGIVGYATIVPDSIGAESCFERLGQHGVDFFSEEHSFLEILKLEVMSDEGRHYRFCADMMFSGHTFITVTVVLAICEMLSRMKSNKLCCPIFAKACCAASRFVSCACNSVTNCARSASFSFDISLI